LHSLRLQVKLDVNKSELTILFPISIIAGNFAGKSNEIPGNKKPRHRRGSFFLCAG
jgi:hypothetical protein